MVRWIVIFLSIAFSKTETLNQSLASPEEASAQAARIETIAYFFLTSLVSMMIGHYCSVKFGMHSNLPSWIIGLLIGAFYQHLGPIGQSLFNVSHVSIFVIIFTYTTLMAFSSNILSNNYMFFSKKWEHSIMTGAGVFISTVLIGLGLKYITPLGKDITLIEGFIIGAMFCCIEPGAFMGRLAGLGVPKRVLSFIQGESAMTPGFAIAIYLMFEAIQTNNGYEFGMTLERFVRLAIVAIAAGFVWGSFFSWLWIRSKRAAIGLSLAFLSPIFLIIFGASSYIHVKHSSLLAMGIFAQVIGFLVKEHMRPEVFTKITVLWSSILDFADVTILLISGTYLGSLYWNDIGRAFMTNYFWQSFIVFLIVLVARIIKVFALAPLFNLIGEGFSWKDFVLIGLTGINGTISVTLVFDMADNMKPYASPKYREIIVGVVCVVVAIQVVYISVLNFIGCTKYPLFQLQLQSEFIVQNKFSVLKNIKARLKQLKRTQEVKSCEYRTLQWLFHLDKHIFRLVRVSYKAIHKFDLKVLSHTTRHFDGSMMYLFKQFEPSFLEPRSYVKRHNEQGFISLIDKAMVPLDVRILEPDEVKINLKPKIKVLDQGIFALNEKKLEFDIKEAQELNFSFNKDSMSSNLEMNGLGGNLLEENRVESIDLKKTKLENNGYQNTIEFRTQNQMPFGSKNGSTGSSDGIIPREPSIQEVHNKDQETFSRRINDSIPTDSHTERSQKIENFIDFITVHSVQSPKVAYQVDIRNSAYNLIRQQLSNAYSQGKCHLRSFNYGNQLIEIAADYHDRPLEFTQVHKQIYPRLISASISLWDKVGCLKPLIHQTVFRRKYLEFEILFLLKTILWEMSQKVNQLFSVFSIKQQSFIRYELTTAESRIRDLLSSGSMAKSKHIYEDCHRVLENSVYQLMVWGHNSVKSGLISEEEYVADSDRYEKHNGKIIKYFADLDRRVHYNFVFEKHHSAFDVGACLIYHFPFLLEMPPQLILEIIRTSQCLRMHQDEPKFSPDPCYMAVPFLVRGQLHARIIEADYLMVYGSESQVLFKLFFLKHLGHEVTLSNIKEPTLLLIHIRLIWKMIEYSDYLLMELFKAIAELFLVDSALVSIISSLPNIVHAVKRKNPKITFDDLFEILTLTRLNTTDAAKQDCLEGELRLKCKDEFENFLVAQDLSNSDTQFKDTVVVTIFGRAVKLQLVVEKLLKGK